VPRAASLLGPPLYEYVAALLHRLQPDNKPAGRTHVEALSDEAGAQVTVQAPGYEQMLSGQKWEELPL
jgi:hypothetical protein